MVSKYAKVVGHRINTLLAEQDIKQSELAEKLRIVSSTVSCFVSGTRMPNTEQLVKIADFFNVSTDYLLGRSRASTRNLDKAFVCDLLKIDEQAVEQLITYKNMPIVPHHGYYWEEIVPYMRYTGRDYINHFNKNLRAFLRSKCLTEILGGCTVEDVLFDSVNAVIEYVNSGVPFENLSSFQRKKLLAFYDISISMLQRHYSNLYGIECVLNEFIEAVTSFDKLDEDEIRKSMVAFEKIVTDYKKQYGDKEQPESLIANATGNHKKTDTPLADQLDRRRRTVCDKLPDGVTLLGFDVNDYQSVSECIVARRIARSDIRLQFEEGTHLTGDQINGYLENMENVLAEMGVDWSDYDFPEELLQEGEEEFYTLAEDIFELVYLDRTFEK